MPHLEQQQQQQQQQHRSEPPLCTHQYASAFGTYRKPTLVTHPLIYNQIFLIILQVEDTLIKTPSSSHALVISNGHMFAVHIKVLQTTASSPLTPDPIPHTPHPTPLMQCLLIISQESPSPSSPPLPAAVIAGAPPLHPAYHNPPLNHQHIHSHHHNNHCIFSRTQQPLNTVKPTARAGSLADVKRRSKSLGQGPNVGALTAMHRCDVCRVTCDV